MEPSVCVVVDGDSLGRRDRLLLAEKILDDATHVGPVLSVFIAGKLESVRKEVAESFRSHCSNAEIIERHPGPRKNSADILCLFYAGHFLGREVAKQRNVTIYVVSRDKAILWGALEILRQGHRLVVVTDPKTTGLPEQHPLFRRISWTDSGLKPISAIRDSVVPQLPDWASVQHSRIHSVGLICQEVSSEVHYPAPWFIPFPDHRDIVTMGSKGFRVNLELNAWEKGMKSQSLYSPHVEFRYLRFPVSSWSVRSCKGHRRGAREVTVSGRIIDASHGFVRIERGTEIRLGDFVFTFQDDRKYEIAQFEDPKAVIDVIERTLRKTMDTIPAECVPGPVAKELTTDGKISWDKGYLRHYQKTILANWDRAEFAKLREKLSSESNADVVFGSLISIRNIAMHPSRPRITERDARRLAEIYLMLTEAMMPPPESRKGTGSGKGL